MTSALPPNLHVEVAQDRGRLSIDSTSSRSPSIRRVASNPLGRIQSLHGDVQYMPSPSSRFMPQQGGIAEESSGTLSAAELAAQLDEEEDDEDDISEKIGVMHDGRWYDDRSTRSSESNYSTHMQGTQAQQDLAPRPYPGVGVYAGAGAQPKPILQNSMVNSPPASIRSRPSLQTPPPRSTSVPDPHAGPGMSLRITTNAHLAGTHTAPSTPTGTGLHGHGHGNGYGFDQRPHGNGYSFDQMNAPNTAPLMPDGYAAQQQFQQPPPQAFPDKPRFTLTDDGPASAPGSPSIRRAVSDSNFHSEGESPLSAGLTPPGRRAGRENRVPSSPSRYNTFEEMGIQAKTQGQAQAKDKECVIM